MRIWERGISPERIKRERYESARVSCLHVALSFSKGNFVEKKTLLNSKPNKTTFVSSFHGLSVTYPQSCSPTCFRWFYIEVSFQKPIYIEIENYSIFWKHATKKLNILVVNQKYGTMYSKRKNLGLKSNFLCQVYILKF